MREDGAEEGRQNKWYDDLRTHFVQIALVPAQIRQTVCMAHFFALLEIFHFDAAHFSTAAIWILILFFASSLSGFARK